MDQQDSIEQEGLPRSFKVWAWQKFDRAVDEWLGLFVIIFALATATWFGVGEDFQDWLKETKPRSPVAATGTPAASGVPVSTDTPIAAIPGPTEGVGADVLGGRGVTPRAAAVLSARVSPAWIGSPTVQLDARVTAIPIPAGVPTLAATG